VMTGMLGKTLLVIGLLSVLLVGPTLFLIAVWGGISDDLFPKVFVTVGVVGGISFIAGVCVLQFEKKA
jgi:hypothetical protein